MVRPPEAAAFLVRAWYEDGQLRARITYLVEPGSGPHAQVTTADPAEVHRHLAEWLHAAGRATDDHDR
ncbi:hypothetical protein [Amycolatopsis alkalitolerans]|uniref:Uncharacterized protein n=1 Tax=Amycolatopsis alkalitolerans TaxID=2547244 RepID=A0A5C4M3I1_9PSEU|nr:hypothetical protein [Amycolatopsis alkalitolerans]TNC25714.1 hypothetical protein FG385_13760 [Amycolatopsis alkalitolerans]